MRFLPRRSNLKCLTAFVRYTSPRSMPASSSARSSSPPAGPTNGRPTLRPQQAHRAREWLAFILLDGQALCRHAELLQAIATHRVADRPDRFEPRAKKRRRNHYNWLTKPRAEIKRKMAKGVNKN